MESGSPGSQRSIPLDVLRWFAVMLVLGRHLTPSCPPHYPAAFRAVLELWKRAGWVGVDLFFVLSGFLVSGLLFQEYRRNAKVSFPRFFLRRGFKIYPSFYLFLVAYGSAQWLMTRNITWRGLIGETFFLQNYVGSIWNHTWTLAVEEHFYIAIGLYVAIARPAHVKTLFYIVAVSCLTGRVLTAYRGNLGNIIGPTHLRMDSLMFGVFLSYKAHFESEALKSFVRRYRYVLCVLAATFLLPVLLVELDGSAYLLTIGLTTVYLAFGGLLLVCIHSTTFFQGRMFGLIATLGACSYSTYLWHMPISRALSLLRKSGRWDLPFVVELALYVILCTLAGLILTRFVERPFLKLRNRILPAARGPASPGDDRTPETGRDGIRRTLSEPPAPENAGSPPSP